MIRDKTYGVRVNEDEDALLKRAAEKLGVKVPSFMRTVGVEMAAQILGESPPPTVQDEVRKFLER